MKHRNAKLMALAMALTLSAGGTAWADGGYPAATTKPDVTMSVTDSKSTTTVNGKGAGEGNSTTTITGTIVATQLKVTVPTTVGFDIDPTITAAKPSSQVTAQSSNITITNQSIVPIYVKVSNVDVAASTGGKAPNLVTSWVDSDQNMMFALKTTEPTNFSTATDWLTSGAISGNYYLDSSQGKLAATGKTGNSVTMKIFGQIGQGWSAGDQFTITPTFTVAVKPYT